MKRARRIFTPAKSPAERSCIFLLFLVSFCSAEISFAGEAARIKQICTKLLSESPIQYVESFPVELDLPVREEPTPYATNFSRDKTTITISDCSELDGLVLEVAKRLGDKEVGAVAIVDASGNPLTSKYAVFSSNKRNAVEASLMNQAVYSLLAEIPESSLEKIQYIVITHNHPKLRDFPMLSADDLTHLSYLGNELHTHLKLRHATITLSAVQTSREGKQSKHSWNRVLRY